MADALHAERREPEQPSGAFDLHAAARELLEQAGNLDAGRAARTLTPGAGAPLKQTLLAIKQGRALEEHTAPGPATIQVIAGAVTLGCNGSDLELSEGRWAAIPTDPHDLRADADAAVLLTVVMPQNG